MSAASRLAIRHSTAYCYADAPHFLAQVARLTPCEGSGQRLLHWQVSDESGVVPTVYRDGFGNLCHLFGNVPPGATRSIVAEGLVETAGADASEWDRIARKEPLAPAYFLRPTARTESTAELRAFARAVRDELPAASRGDARDEGLRLAERICEQIAHQAGTTTVETRADEAFAARAGVCQDRTHLLLVMARELGHPARYVSGYWYGAAVEDAGAMHAWAELWHENEGWLAIDPSNGGETTPAHVRVAIGLDYVDAAPLRGVRRGGVGESLSVSVSVGSSPLQENQ